MSDNNPIGSGQTNQIPNSVAVLTTDRIATESLYLSQQGENFIKGFERLVLNYYDDDFGFCTVGWGHLVNSRVSCHQLGINTHTTVPQEYAQQLFDADKIKQEKIVKRAIRVPLFQKEFDALCSLNFNIGDISLKAPTLCRKINSGRYSEAARELLEITNGGVRGLVIRRQREYQMYIDGKYDSNH